MQENWSFHATNPSGFCPAVRCVSSPDLAVSGWGDLSLDPHGVSLQDSLWEMLEGSAENWHRVGSCRDVFVSPKPHWHWQLSADVLQVVNSYRVQCSNIYSPAVPAWKVDWADEVKFNSSEGFLHCKCLFLINRGVGHKACYELT